MVGWWWGGGGVVVGWWWGGGGVVVGWWWGGGGVVVRCELLGGGVIVGGLGGVGVGPLHPIAPTRRRKRTVACFGLVWGPGGGVWVVVAVAFMPNAQCAIPRRPADHKPP